MRICTSCGSGLPDYAQFCGSCGNSSNEPLSKSGSGLRKVRLAASRREQTASMPVSDQPSAEPFGSQPSKDEDLLPIDKKSTLHEHEVPPATFESVEQETSLDIDKKPTLAEHEALLIDEEALSNDNVSPDDLPSQVARATVGEKSSPDPDSEALPVDKKPTLAEHEATYSSSSSFNEERTRSTLSETPTLREHSAVLPYATEQHRTELSNFPEAPVAAEQEEEEERRKRAILMGMALPLFADAFKGNAEQSIVPQVQGTPQIGAVPLAPGNPYLGSPTAGSSVSTSVMTSPPASVPGPVATPVVPPTTPALVLPSPELSPFPFGPGSVTRPDSPSPVSPSSSPVHGCMNIFILTNLIVLLVVAVLGGSFMVFYTPTLSMNGSANVASGSTLHLHGTNFMPNSSISFLLDDSLALNFVDQHTNHATNVLALGWNNSFDISLTVEKTWSAGSHTIRASEQMSMRSAALSIRVVGGTNQVSATPSSQLTPTPTLSFSPTPNTSPTATTDAIKIAPTSLSFGQVEESWKQPISLPVRLSSTSNQNTLWTANWDQKQTPWLQVTPSSGNLQPPLTQTITVTAQNNGLKAGDYTAIINFTNKNDNKQQSLNVTFSVVADCIGLTPTSLSFNGVVGNLDPSPQTVTISTCTMAANWSVDMPNDASQWLSISQSTGSIATGRTQTVTISASVVKSGLAAGNYQTKLLFKNGNAQATLPVVLIVTNSLILSANTQTINANHDCNASSAADGYWVCTITLSSTASASEPLEWTAGSSGLPGVVFRPASGTLQPGKSVRVTMEIPNNDCQKSGTFLFNGPQNTVTIAWSCA